MKSAAGKLPGVSKTEILDGVTKLKPEERQEIRAKLNELDGIAEEAWSDDGDLTDEEKRILDKRLAQFDAGANSGSSWPESEARIREKLEE